MMGAQRDQQNDWDRDTDQPEQDGAHDYRLLLHRSLQQWFSRRNCSEGLK